MPWKSLSEARNTVVFTIRSRLLPASVRIASRLSIVCSVCALIPGPTTSVWPGSKPELARHEHEPVRLDRLRVRRALERGRRVLGAHDGLAVHRHSFRFRGRAAWASATPSALKIASSTCCGSSPSMSRTCRVRPPPSASSCRKLATRSVPSPPTLASDRSTFETTSGRPDASRTMCASASSAAATADPWPRTLVGGERLPQRLAERLARGRHLGLAGLRRELQLDVERPVARDEPEQVIEHGQARGHVALARAVERHTHASVLLLTHPVGGRHRLERGYRTPAARADDGQEPFPAPQAARMRTRSPSRSPSCGPHRGRSGRRGRRRARAARRALRRPTAPSSASSRTPSSRRR